jgi:Tol biopolymer transport system component
MEHTLQFYSLKDKTLAPFGGIVSRAPTAAAFSPDGRWVAYESGEYAGADRSIYVQPFPATGARYQVPKLETGGQRHPLWSRDGRELFFMNGGEIQLMVAGVMAQPSLRLPIRPPCLSTSPGWTDSETPRASGMCFSTTSTSSGRCGRRTQPEPARRKRAKSTSS